MSEKTVTSGKRFSRIERTEITDESQLAAVLKKHGRPNGKGGYTIGHSFRERMEMLAAGAAALLRDRGLPDAAVVYWTRSTPDKWQTEKPSAEDFKARSFVDHYICKQRGYGHDSREGIAAQILVHASRLWSGTAEQTAEAAFELGELRTLAKVYGLESRAASRAAKGDRKKPWAVALADHLVAGDPNASARELWVMIPEDEGERFAGYEVFREGEYLRASSSSGDDAIKYATFRTEYISEARKKTLSGSVE